MAYSAVPHRGPAGVFRPCPEFAEGPGGRFVLGGQAGAGVEVAVEGGLQPGAALQFWPMRFEPRCALLDVGLGLDELPALGVEV